MNTISHNLMAANVANNLNSHYAKLATSVERLSSGLRINSAADDAAGLATRELMRVEVAALNQGMRNASDAISMIQVADGALGIIDEKLIRMKELAEQAATGTYDSTQRMIINSEYLAMAAEIDRIARATEFNGIHLLDGSLSGAHNGNGLKATGAMKIHFGTANDKAEDYYYVEIGACTTKALGLGQGKTGTYIKVESQVDAPLSFKPRTSYVEYVDPNTNKKYYTDGNFFFSSISNPGGTMIDETRDREIIARLRTTPETTKVYFSYRIYVDPRSNKEYYSDGSSSFCTDPYNPWNTELDEDNPVDKDIMDHLQRTDKSMRVTLNYEVYETPDGERWFTSNGGRTFSRDPRNPDDIKVDLANPDDKKFIDTLKASSVTVNINLPTITLFYDKYMDKRTGIHYYSDDGGNTFVSRPNDPGSRLHPERDKEIIANLEVIPELNLITENFSYYTDPATGVIYSKLGSNYYIDVKDPDSIAFSEDNPADATAIAALRPVVSTAMGTIRYEIYEDLANGGKRYYKPDGVELFFSDPSDPLGSVLDKNAPDYANLTANFNKIDGEGSFLITYERYRDPTTRTDYFTSDGGRTFVARHNAWPLPPALDSANPDDQKTIVNLEPYVSGGTNTTMFDVYKDPDTNVKYYKSKDGSNVYFKVMGKPETQLNPDDEGDKRILDRLKPIPQQNNLRIQTSFPDVYYMYEDTVTGTVYYSPDGGVTFNTRTDNPHTNKLDPARDKHIIDRLKPMAGGTKIIETWEYVESAGSQLTISTQQAAQGALAAIDDAIVAKDKVRAHLGALQNRLENTVTNLTVQAENLQAAEARISDADVAMEMTLFVRNQILTQSAVAMLGQANSYPHMLMNLLQS